MSERWRCFVAVPVGEQLRAALAAAAETWRSHPDAEGLRWADSHGWHVTLAFLGDIEVDRVPAMATAIAGIAAERGPLQRSTGGLGAFPSPGHARVLWYGVADAEGSLSALAADVRRALGIEAGAFRAHVTLARARRAAADVRGLVSEATAPDGAIDVERIDLMRSHLGRGPARYERLASAALGAPAHV